MRCLRQFTLRSNPHWIDQNGFDDVSRSSVYGVCVFTGKRDGKHGRWLVDHLSEPKEKYLFLAHRFIAEFDAEKVLFVRNRRGVEPVFSDIMTSEGKICFNLVV